jgi:hypothetical protein
MEIRQRRNSNRIRYVFGEDEVQYSLEDTSGSRSFSVAYTDISRDRQTLVERNQWLGCQVQLGIGREQLVLMPLIDGELKLVAFVLQKECRGTHER